MVFTIGLEVTGQRLLIVADRLFVLPSVLPGDTKQTVQLGHFGVVLAIVFKVTGQRLFKVADRLFVLPQRKWGSDPNYSLVEGENGGQTPIILSSRKCVNIRLVSTNKSITKPLNSRWFLVHIYCF
jgi:hypothetical protein